MIARVEVQADLRRRAEGLAQALPPLLAAADQLAASVMPGAHGRRRVGVGDEFWQYRAAVAGDPARLVDWRRSGRSDAHFVREREWQAAQSVLFWVDRSAAMDFSGARARAPKGQMAAILALALAVLLERGGERIGLADGSLPARAGRTHLARMAEALAMAQGEAAAGDYGRPPVAGYMSRARAVFISDFLGDPAALDAAMAAAAGAGVRGVALQLLDPAEESFPYDGRTIFESMAGGLRHETRRAGDLRARYRARLAERKAWLEDRARRWHWQYHCHHTDRPASAALMWLYQAIERGR